MLPVASLRLKEGDVLIVEGGKDDILEVKGTTGIDLTADVLFSDLSRTPQISKSPKLSSYCVHRWWAGLSRERDLESGMAFRS